MGGGGVLSGPAGSGTLGHSSPASCNHNHGHAGKAAVAGGSPPVSHASPFNPRDWPGIPLNLLNHLFNHEQRHLPGLCFRLMLKHQWTCQ